MMESLPQDFQCKKNLRNGFLTVKRIRKVVEDDEAAVVDQEESPGCTPAARECWPPDLRPEVDDLTTRFNGVSTLVGDVSREDTAVRSVAAAIDRFGSMDILVSNAGRSVNKPITETTAADWDELMSINARGAFLHAREAFRAMREHSGGVIVTVGSFACTVGLVEAAAYSASKGALAQLTMVLALEGGPHGIHANVVAPV
jgi:NAD(P)-dependent dehydrogenase (short-subunit alcohol dehydrogenase family)